jgi:hypothetical protein
VEAAIRAGTATESFDARLRDGLTDEELRAAEDVVRRLQADATSGPPERL